LINKWNQFYPHIDIYFTGPDQIKIMAKASDFSVSDFNALIKKRLREHLNLASTSKIKLLNPPRRVQLPESDYYLDFNFEKAKHGFTKIKLFISGKQKKQFFIRFEVLRKLFVLVSTRDLERGESLSEEFILPKEVYISNKVKALPVQDISRLKQLKLKRKLNSGDILTKIHVAYKNVVKSRQKLKGIIKRNNLKVEMEVVALQKGKIGDKIMVLFPLTRKKYLATVISERVVVIDL
ncbi:flagellar basal body P-ring formation chaperone FlgA, partial [bacterium]|nr:flagellar basal body P-ring formation chaperone FlgA [bacterium]